MIGNNLVECDAEATRAAYAKVVGGIDSCRCEYCVNYRLAREQIYPPEFRDLLEELGIDYRKEVELDHLTEDDADDGLDYGQSVSGHYAFRWARSRTRQKPSMARFFTFRLWRQIRFGSPCNGRVQVA